MEVIFNFSRHELNVLHSIMTEGVWNIIKNKGENICITWSEIKHGFCTPQTADENMNNNAKENSNNSDVSSDENEMSLPLALDCILSPSNDDNRCANELAMSSSNSTDEVRHETSQNCTHYEMYRHLGCTNNATYGIQSSSSESEPLPPTAAAEVELELELLSLVAEFAQDRQTTEATCCRKCCHGTCSKNFGFWISGEDLAKNNPNHCCFKHRQKENTGLRGAGRKHVPTNKDQKRRHTESCDNVMVTQGPTARSVSRSPRPSGVDVGKDLKQYRLFAGKNANKSSHLDTLSATKTDTANRLQQQACHQVYRESMDNYVPAKYWERHKLASVLADQDIPLCPTTENYWDTAARDPVTNPFHLPSYENGVCLEQSCNNTSGCNNTACGNSVQLLNTSSFYKFQQAGNYVDHTKREVGIVASVCNENMAANCSQVHAHLDGMWKDSEKNINQRLTSLATVIPTRRPASEKVIDSRLQSGCNVGKKEMLDRKNQAQDPRLKTKEKPNQRVGSIQLSFNQQKGNGDMYGHLLDTSKYRKTNEKQEMKSQPSLSCSNTFPTGNFNEIIQNTNGMLAVYPKTGKRSYCCKRSSAFERITSPEHRGPMSPADIKESSLCQIKPTDSRNQLLPDPLNTCLNSTDNKNMQQIELSYPVWYTRMQSVMQRIRNPPQYINDQSKSSKYQRLKHSRNCRRRRGIDGAICCNRCLLDMPLDGHTSLRDNTIEKRNALDNHKNSKGRRSSKYLTKRSKNTKLSRKCRRKSNTNLRHNGRRPKYAGRRHHNRRSTSMGLRRRGRRSAYHGLRHHNCKRRSSNVRHNIMKSRYTRQGSTSRRSRHTGSRRTKYTR